MTFNFSELRFLRAAVAEQPTCDVRRAVLAKLDAQLAAQRERPRFVFTPEEDGAWLVGPVVECKLHRPVRPLRGLALAHAAIARPGRLISLKGSPNADREAKNAAASWLATWCGPVAAVVRSICVSGTGWIYNDRGQGPLVLTCFSPVSATRGEDSALL